MLRTPSGAPKVRSPAKSPPKKKPALPAHLAFEDPSDPHGEMDAYAFDEPDAAWNALGDLAENAAALEEAEAGPRPGKVKPGKKRGRSEEDEGDEGAKKRIVERGGRPAGTPVLRTINALTTRLLGGGEDDETDEGIMPTQAAPTEEDLAAERKSRRRSLPGRVLGAARAALTWRKGKGASATRTRLRRPPPPTSPALISLASRRRPAPATTTAHRPRASLGATPSSATAAPTRRGTRTSARLGAASSGVRRRLSRCAADTSSWSARVSSTSSTSFVPTAASTGRQSTR